MGMSDIYTREFHAVGELVEDCSSIRLINYKTIRRVIKKIKGKKLEVVFKVLEFTRSNAQNRWLWGVAYITIAAFLKETQGRSYSKEEVHEHSKQYVLNDGATETSVVLTQDEYTKLIDTVSSKGMEYGEEVRDLYTCNVKVVDVASQRVVVSSSKLKSTSNLSTRRFNEFKERLQEWWGELGCYIRDPNENNFLTDHIDDV